MRLPLLLLLPLALAPPTLSWAAADEPAERASAKTTKKKAKRSKKAKQTKKKRTRRAAKKKRTRRVKVGPKPRKLRAAKKRPRTVRRAVKKPSPRRAARRPEPRPFRRHQARPKRAQTPRKAARTRHRRRPPPPRPTPAPHVEAPAGDADSGSDTAIWIDTRHNVRDAVRDAEGGATAGPPRAASGSDGLSDPHAGSNASGASGPIAVHGGPQLPGPDKNRPGADDGGVDRASLPALTAEVPEQPPAEPDRLVRGVRFDGSYSNWALQPIATDRQTTGQAELATSTRYDIAPIHLYRGALTVDTRYASFSMAYETDRGFSTGADSSTLFNVLVQLTGVPGLDRLSLEYRHLDFRYGEAELVQRGSGEVVEHADFDVLARTGELRYRFDGGIFLSGRYAGYALPRTLFLEEDDPAGTLYRQVSFSLLEVDADVWLLGAGWANDPARSPWRAGVHLGGGGGPYDINGLSTGQTFDSGRLVAISASAHLGYHWSVNDWLALGVRDELTVFALDPVGLPDELDRDLQDEGLDTDRFSLDLGASDLLNHLTLYAELSL